MIMCKSEPLIEGAGAGVGGRGSEVALIGELVEQQVGVVLLSTASRSGDCGDGALLHHLTGCDHWSGYKWVLNQR